MVRTAYLHTFNSLLQIGIFLALIFTLTSFLSSLASLLITYSHLIRCNILLFKGCIPFIQRKLYSVWACVFKVFQLVGCNVWTTACKAFEKCIFNFGSCNASPELSLHKFYLQWIRPTIIHLFWKGEPKLKPKNAE